MARSILNDKVVLEAPEVQEDQKVYETLKVKRPSSKLTYEKIVKEREALSKELEELKVKLDETNKDLEANTEDADKCAEVLKKQYKIDLRIKRLRKDLEIYDLDICRKAFDILENGDPVDYLIKVYHKWHLGDTSLGKVLLLSIANTVITNTKGLQPKGSGTSGKGKTDAFEAIYKLIPDEPYKYRGTVSAKSLYYKPDMIDGMIIFSDDVQMNDDLEGTLKRSMGSFQENPTHATLIKQVYKETKLPKRIAWWLTSVDTNYSDELINRLFDLSVDESAEMDKKVAAKTFADTTLDEENLPSEEEIRLCQTIIHIIKRQLFTVKIPFGKYIQWNVPGDRRNPSRFVSLVMGFAVFKYLQREETKEGYTLADVDDYLDAKELYEEGKASQISKLTNAELRLVRWMVAKNRALSINDIVNGYDYEIPNEGKEPVKVKVEPYTKGNGEKYSYQAIKKILVGEQYKGKKGLIDKVPMKITETKSDTRYYIEEFKEFSGDAVTLNMPSKKKAEPAKA